MSSEQRYKKIYKISIKHPKIKALIQPKLDWIRKQIIINKKTKILDAGCGNGRLQHYLEKVSDNVTGIDKSKYLVSQNKCKKTIIGSVLKLPFKNNAFDITMCNCLLHHLKNPIKALKEMERVTKNYVIAIEPNKHNPFIILNSIKTKEKELFKYDKKQVIRDHKNLKLVRTSTQGFISYKKVPCKLMRILTKIEGEILGCFNITIWKVT